MWIWPANEGEYEPELLWEGPAEDQQGSARYQWGEGWETQHVNCRYLNDDLIVEQMKHHGTIVLASPQGTNKTGVLNPAIAEYIGQGKKAAAITPRQSLALQFSSRTGASNYQDSVPGSLLEIKDGEATVLCLDSVRRLRAAKGGKRQVTNLVILDESEQIVRHLFGETIKEKLSEVGAALFKRLKEAEHVLCADADAGRLTAKLLELSGRSGVVVVNDHKKWTFSPGVEILENDTKAGMLQIKMQIRSEVQAWKQGDAPNMVACTSCGEAKRITADLRCHLGDARGADIATDPYISGVLLVCSDTREMEAVRRFLKNPNEEIKNWRCVVYSPTMGTGVTIDTPVGRVFGVMTAVRGITGPDNVQLVTRARSQEKPMVLWLDGGTFDDMSKTVEDARQRAEDALEKANELVKNGKCSSVDTYLTRRKMFPYASQYVEGDDSTESKLYELWLLTQAETGRTGWNPSQSTLEILRLRGARIVSREGGEAMDKDEEQAIKDAIRVADVEGIVNAEPLTEEERGARFKDAGNPIRLRQIKKSAIEKRLGEPVREESAQAEVDRDALAAGSKAAKMRALHQGGELAQLLMADLSDHVQQGRKVSAIRSPWLKLSMQYEALKVCRLEGLLEGKAPSQTLEERNAEEEDLWVWMQKMQNDLFALGISIPKQTENPEHQLGYVRRWLLKLLLSLGYRCDEKRVRGHTRYHLTQARVDEALRWSQKPYDELRARVSFSCAS